MHCNQVLPEDSFNVLTHQITVKWLSSECSLLSEITAGPITVFYCIYTSLRGEKLSWREILRAISHLTAESFKSVGISDESDDLYEAAARFSDLFSEECLPKLCLINTDFLLRNFQTSSDCLKKEKQNRVKVWSRLQTEHLQSVSHHPAVGGRII